MLIPECGHRRRGQGEVLPGSGLQSQPAGGQYPEKVAMGEDKDVPGGSFELPDDTIGAPSNVGRPLAPRAAVAPQRPVGILPANFGTRDPLVLPVIPLPQVRVHEGRHRKPGEPAGFLRTLQRAGQDQFEVPLLQNWPDGHGLFSARLRQGNVGATGMAAIAAPLRLAVADENDLGLVQVRSVAKLMLEAPPLTSTSKRSWAVE